MTTDVTWSFKLLHDRKANKMFLFMAETFMTIPLDPNIWNCNSYSPTWGQGWQGYDKCENMAGRGDSLSESLANSFRFQVPSCNGLFMVAIQSSAKQIDESAK